MNRPFVLSLLAAALLPAPARALINIGTIDSSDGAFSPAASREVDLSQAVTGAWDVANTGGNIGKGRYDADKWAVVYKFSSVNIPAGVTVTFRNHPSRAPVVWLVQGSVTIAGTLQMDGADGANTGAFAEPGPGGFRGGIGGSTGVPWSAGFGPGGLRNAAASYGEAAYYNPNTYGNPRILPLIAGSGGSGQSSQRDGGAGGGALLIAARDTITVSGTINARGGSGYFGGSGGAIRLIADRMAGAGTLSTAGRGSSYPGGNGRIRLEANTMSFGGPATPAASLAVPLTADPLIWPGTDIPKVAITQVGAAAAPADPRAGIGTPAPDITLSTTAPVTVRIQATNVPSTWTVQVRLTPLSGDDAWVNATKVSGNDASSVWEATISPPSGISALQVRAKKP